MKLKGKKMEKQYNNLANNNIDLNSQELFAIVISPNGKQIEFIDGRPNSSYEEPGKPNVTRLVFGQPYRENGQILASDGQIYSGLPEQTNRGIQPLYNAKVSWYNDDDAIMLDKEGEDVGRRGAYRNIVLGVDLARLNMRDLAYCKELFLGLLDHNRVEQYLHTALLVDPKDPDDHYSKQEKCGNYVGHVAPGKYGKYSKYFSGVVGEIVHDSPEMVEKRKQYYESVLATLQEQDDRDKQTIMELQKKIKAREPKRDKIIKTLELINGKEEKER